MNVIDKILSEWSYRCHDGIVDMHNPKKVSILKEILVEYKILNEDVDDDILNMLSNIDDTNTKEKVLMYLQNINKEEDKEEIDQLKDEVSPQSFRIIYNKIIPYLENKGLPEDKILALIARFAKEDEDHSCPGCIKNLPLNDDQNNSLVIIDLTADD
jgi:hypothetical protein